MYGKSFAYELNFSFFCLIVMLIFSFFLWSWFQIILSYTFFVHKKIKYSSGFFHLLFLPCASLQSGTIKYNPEVTLLSILQSWTKFLKQNREIQLKWTSKEKFDIYFCVFLAAIPKYYYFRKGDWALGCLHPNLRFS